MLQILKNNFLQILLIYPIPSTVRNRLVARFNSSANHSLQIERKLPPFLSVWAKQLLYIEDQTRICLIAVGIWHSVISLGAFQCSSAECRTRTVDSAIALPGQYLMVKGQ